MGDIWEWGLSNPAEQHVRRRSGQSLSNLCHMPPAGPQLIPRIEVVYLFQDGRLILGPEGPVPSGIPFKQGDTVTLKRPDGGTVDTRIVSVEMPNPNPQGVYPFVLEGVTSKDEVPIGSEVWTRPEVGR
mgnify:CR=1 FL=1